MQKQIVQILDYGVGNLNSVYNMISKCGGKPVLVSKAIDLNLHEKIILPGVGHYCIGIDNLRTRGFEEVLREAVYVNKVPFLGICLGMQLLFDSSEEGNGIGLGFISGQVKRFSTDNNPNLKIPHMGWNSVKVRKSCALATADEDEMRFYFVHSYYATCQNEEDIFMTTTYGSEFVSAVCKDNIYGAQFHPEKSHKFGIGIFSNFIKINN